jgi:predicted ATPase with chaperone activity
MASVEDLLSSFEAAPVAGPNHKPRSLAEIDIRQQVLEDLSLKTLFLSGPFSVYQLADRIHLSFEIATELFNRLRDQQLCQVTGMRGNVPMMAITSQGRSRALELLSHNHYVGAAPISLDSYVVQVRKQSVREVATHQADVARAFKHMVLDEKKLWQLGTALNSGTSIFLHGPSGVGKSAMAETLSRVLAEDAAWIPYAVEVDGQIITVYDPVIHKKMPAGEFEVCDERWVRCHRPTVLVGGELTVEMLDLQFNPVTKYYVCPAQMKANNGVLIIDDFGRQRIRPDELLNRWVVPMDRRIDFLTLSGGRKIEIPFDMLVVFATNMNPSELVDPAFLRRIQTKIRVGSVSDDQFCQIFSNVAAEKGLEAEKSLLSELVTVIRGMDEELKPCYPRDLVNQVCWAAKFEDKKPELNREALMHAVEAYFLPHE